MLKKIIIIFLIITTSLTIFFVFRHYRRINRIQRNKAENIQDTKNLKEVINKTSQGDCKFNGYSKETRVYKEIPGVDPNYLSADFYSPKAEGACDTMRPIMIYVHGGAWQRGDKANQINAKASYFTSQGYLFVSVNYRLVPAVMYPSFNQDVADAVKYIYDNAGNFNAGKEKMVIMGHSAGGGIISAITTDEKYLTEVGLTLNSIRCAISLDTEGYDVSLKATENTQVYHPAFGTNAAIWSDASPINHVSSGKGIPSFFIVTRGNKFRVEIANQFTEKLKEAEIFSELMETPKLDHEEVNAAVGSDDLITPKLQSFLEAHCE